MKNILIAMTEPSLIESMVKKAMDLNPQSLTCFVFDKVEKEVESAFAKHSGTNNQIKTEVITSSFHPEESQYHSFFTTVQTNKWDLVMAPRPKVGTETEGLFFAKKVLQECPIPALLLCGKGKWKSPLKVLATIDVLDESEQQSTLNKVVLQYCQRLTNSITTKNTAVCVIPISRISQEFDLVEPGNVVSEKGQAILENLKHVLNVTAPSLEIASKVVAGTPSREISSMASKLEANLVVMGNVARKGLQGLFIGNTAERILTCLTTDILIVRSQ